MPDNSIEPHEKSHENIRIFQKIRTSALKAPEYLERRIYEDNKHKDHPNSWKDAFWKFHKLTLHEPDVVSTIEMCPPVEYGHSSNHPADRLVHESIDWLSVIFF